MRKNKRKKSYYFGVFSEFFVCAYLCLRFYTILNLRYKTPSGEIDIVAKKGNHIIFVEVKARKASANIADVLSYHQKQRIKRAADIFISRNPRFVTCNASFELFAVWPFGVKRIRDAF